MDDIGKCDNEQAKESISMYIEEGFNEGNGRICRAYSTSRSIIISWVEASIRGLNTFIVQLHIARAYFVVD